MSPRTVFLARLFGLFMTVAAIWMVVDESGLHAVALALAQDRPVTMLLSLMCLAAGLAVVLGHQVWSGGVAPVLVTLLGWLLTLRGVVLLFLPARLLESVVSVAATPALLYGAGAVALGMGLILTYAGFRAPPIVANGK